MKVFPILILVAVFLYDCSPEKYKDVSFSEQVKPILVKECLPCHGENNPASGMQLTKYEHLFGNYNNSGSASLVSSGKPNQSRLYVLISTNKAAVRMPPESYGYEKMDESDIKLIKAWIEEGAKNN